MSSLHKYVNRSLSTEFRSSTPNSATSSCSVPMDSPSSSPLHIEENLSGDENNKAENGTERDGSISSKSVKSNKKAEKRKSSVDTTARASKRRASSTFSPLRETPTKGKKEGKYTSDQWHHFHRGVVEGKEDLGLRAICDYCNNDYLISGTGNMKVHIETKHADKLTPAELQALKQTTLDSQLQVVKPFKFDSQVTDAKLETFIVDGLFQANDISQELTDSEIEELSKLVPQLDVVTRWSSVFFMIERALKLRQGLDYAAFVIKELRVTHLIQPDEWVLLEEIFEFLKPFADSTRHMEGCRYPTLQTVIPLYNKLLDKVETWSEDEERSTTTREAARRALEKMSEYYDKLTPIYIVATVLDPRLKLSYFEENGWGEEKDHTDKEGRTLMETRIKPALQDFWAKYRTMIVEDRSNNGDPDKAGVKDNSFVADLFKKKKKSAYKEELDAYLAEDVEDGDTDILTYWRFKSSKWPRMAAMAQDILAITATSASSERSFSTGKTLLGINRHSLLPESMEACVCLRSWIRGELLKGAGDDQEDFPPISEKEIDEILISMTDDELLDAITGDEEATPKY